MSGDRTWAIVQAVFDKGVRCEACPHYEAWEENHGPGLREPLCRCRVLDEGTDPGECPAVADWEDECAT